MIKIYTTNYRYGERQTEISEWEFNSEEYQEWGLLSLYSEVKYQTFYGFGGAITEAAAYAYSLLNDKDKEQVIQGYYGEKGLNYTYGRLHIDSCDFCLENYCAKETPESEFSLKHDEEYVIPFLREIEKTKKLKYMMSPWSPPAYMKTTGKRNGGGKLLKEYYAAWAEHICKYLEKYIEMGFNISLLSVQNEPNATLRWDTCVYTTEEEGDFLVNYLYPELQKRNLGHIKRLIWDHNRERAYERLRDILKIVGSVNCVDGVAYHWYSGDYFENLQMVYELYPDKLSVFSEGCVEYSGYSKDTDKEWMHAEKYAYNILNCLKNGCNLFLDWNILLDNKGGPNHAENYCAAPMMLDENNRLIKKITYDMIGHFSKHIQVGARRIGISGYTDKLDYVAFENPDGRIITVVLNRQEENLYFHLRKNNKHTKIEIKAKTIQTIVSP